MDGGCVLLDFPAERVLLKKYAYCIGKFYIAFQWADVTPCRWIVIQSAVAAFWCLF